MLVGQLWFVAQAMLMVFLRPRTLDMPETQTAST